MATFRSTWAESPIPIDGTVSAAHWGDAGTLAFTAGSVTCGVMLVKNDASYLYVTLDVTGGSWKATPAESGWFQLSVDADSACGFTPPGDRLRKRRRHADAADLRGVGPMDGRGLGRGGALKSAFGPSLASAAPHRIWQIKIALAQLGIAGAGFAAPSAEPASVAVRWGKPTLRLPSPAEPETSFGKLHRVFLALQPITIPAVAEKSTLDEERRRHDQDEKIAEQEKKIAELTKQIDDLSKQLAVATAKLAIEPLPPSPDDLEVIVGIGPKIADLLRDAGIKTYKDLAAAGVADLAKILVAGGTRFATHDPSSWPGQAQLLVEGKGADLEGRS